MGMPSLSKINTVRRERQPSTIMTSLEKKESTKKNNFKDVLDSNLPPLETIGTLNRKHSGKISKDEGET